MKRSKTNKEIFEEKYPIEEISNNLALIIEAVGYLKALITYFPSEEQWAGRRLTSLLILMMTEL
jgi:hypothetical protein